MARHGRGAERLLAHLEALERLVGERRPSARERLEEALGPQEASRLVRALTGASGRPGAEPPAASADSAS